MKGVGERLTSFIECHSQAEVAFAYVADNRVGQVDRRCDVPGVHWQQLQSAAAVPAGITDSHQQQRVICSRVQHWAALAIQLWRITCTARKAACQYCSGCNNSTHQTEQALSACLLAVYK